MTPAAKIAPVRLVVAVCVEVGKQYCGLLFITISFLEIYTTAFEKLLLIILYSDEVDFVKKFTEVMGFSFLERPPLLVIIIT